MAFMEDRIEKSGGGSAGSFRFYALAARRAMNICAPAITGRHAGARRCHSGHAARPGGQFRVAHLALAVTLRSAASIMKRYHFATETQWPLPRR
jgi:hypothetical protein